MYITNIYIRQTATITNTITIATTHLSFFFSFTTNYLFTNFKIAEFVSF